MRVVVAPNALKGSLSASNAAKAIAEGLRRADASVETLLFPIADGGDGTSEVLASLLGGQLESVLASDALGRPVEASYARLDATRAAIDVASASGIARLTTSELDVFSASSFGTGELLLAAARAGATDILLGVGGSASVDGGLGLLRALGVRSLDANGHEVSAGARGLAELVSFDPSALDPAVRAARITILCDVEAQLLAALDYATQKGAASHDLPRLERALGRLGDVIAQQTSVDVRALTGGGAAGGIPATLSALLGARVVSGIDYVLDAGDFDTKLAGASLVLSAEGRFDAQSLSNKGPFGVARRAHAHGLPCIVLAGSIARDVQLAGTPVTAVLPIAQTPCELDHARSVAADWLAGAAEQTLRVFQSGIITRALC